MTDSIRDQLDAEAESDAGLLQAQRKEPAPEPAPEPTTAAEPAPEPAEPAPPRGDDSMVPLAALREERQRRQQLEQQQREMQQQMAELRGKFDGLAQGRQPAPEPEKPDPEPKYDDNPAEWFRWRDRQNAKEIASLKKTTETYEAERKQRQEAERVQQQQQQVVSAYANAANQFAAETPDWRDAYQFLAKSRVDELVALGYNPQQANAYQQQEEFNIAVNCMQQGVNPAEKLYTIAKMRGYTKGEQPAPAPTPAPAPLPLPTGALRAQVSKSLSSAPGAPSNPPTTAQLADLDDDAYARAVPSTDAFRRMMGG